jgi:Ca2+-binding EF-hand superfamily protein
MVEGDRQHGMRTLFGYFPIRDCWSPQRQPIVSTAFFVAFILIAAFVLLSLFVGAVCGAMSDALDAFKEQAEAERQARNASLQSEQALKDAMKVDSAGYRIQVLREAFDACDEDHSGEISAVELSDMFTSMGEVGVTVEMAAEMIAALNGDEEHHSIGFPEFYKLMTGSELSASDRRVDQSSKHRKSLTILQIEDPDAAEVEFRRRTNEAKEKKLALKLVSKVLIFHCFPIWRIF